MGIIDFEKYRYNPHEMAELICVQCHKRWVGVFPVGTKLKDLECPGCGDSGFVIKTGENLMEDE